MCFFSNSECCLYLTDGNYISQHIILMYDEVGNLYWFDYSWIRAVCEKNFLAVEELNGLKGVRKNIQSSDFHFS